jgi:arylsulfatase A-like enzyme
MDALPPDQAPWVRSLYDGEVTYLDEHLGELFDALKKWGLYDDALIVFTADHGEEFFEHGGWGHGATLYEEQLRVPLIVKYPGNIHAGTVDEGFARSLDLAPTILDVVGVPMPAAVQGVSLRPGEDAPARASVLFAETTYQGRYPMQAVRVGSSKLILTAAGHPRLTPLTLLFDLETDPGEHQDKSSVEPDAVRMLQAELDQVAAFAREHAVAHAPQAGQVDPSTQERLRNLGY